MLVLSRYVGQSIRIGQVTVKILDVRGGRIVVGCDAPHDLRIERGEEKPAKKRKEKAA